MPHDISTASPRVRLSEELLLSFVPEFAGENILCTSQGRAQLAAAIARQRPQAHVSCHYLDLYLAERAREVQAQDLGASVPVGLGNLAIVCEPELPAGEFDVVAFPMQAHGEAELTRERMQDGHQRLRIGGKMFVSTDNARDKWLGDQMRAIFGSQVVKRAFPRGVVYFAKKRRPLKKVKQYAGEFAFRDQGRLIWVESRPGVFCHRRLDQGTRALIESLTVGEGEQTTEVVRDGFRVLDLGCGAGPVTFAASLRAANVRVHAVDSNPRALQCTQAGAARNGLPNVTTQLAANGECNEPGVYDLVLGNPPYYSQFKIAELFLETARQALKPGGRVHFVTKNPDWFVDAMSTLFNYVTARPLRTYFVVSGVSRSRK